MDQDMLREADAGALYAIHEMCQPLTAILLNAKAALLWMNQDQPNLEEMKRSLEGIVGNGQRAADIARQARDTLRASRTMAASLDLNGIVHECLALARPNLKRHGIAIELELAEGLAPVRGNGVQFSSLVTNLIANAVDAMSALDRKRRRLRIATWTSESGELHCSVADSGTGIEPAQMERIFEPYFSTKCEGLGLGLSLCKSIVATHGGRLWASHNRPHGTVFSFSLPPVETSVPAPRAEAAMARD